MPRKKEHLKPPVPLRKKKVDNEAPLVAMKRVLSSGSAVEMERILNRGLCSPDISLDDEGSTPLISVTKQSVVGEYHMKMLSILKREGCQLDATNVFGQTACMFACMNGSYETVKLLIGWGCNIHISDQFDMTAFLYAVQNGCVDILQLLKDSGADVDAPTREGLHPMMYSAMSGQTAALGWFVSECKQRLEEDHLVVLAKCSLRESN